jgi:hypothetical protein
MKYKIGDVVIYEDRIHTEKIIICDIIYHHDPVYRIRFIDKNGNMSLAFTDHVTTSR